MESISDRGFVDIAIDESHGWSIGYRSGSAVFEEGLRDGQLVALGYNASGYLMTTNPLPAPAWINLDNRDFIIFPRPESFGLAVDGQSLNSHWKIVCCDREEADGRITARIRLSHTVRPVEVTVCTEIDGTPVFRRWIEVKNTGDRPAAINELAPLSGALQAVIDAGSHLKDGEALYQLGYLHSHRWCNEGEFRWIDLPEEIFTVAGRYRKDRHRHPMFVLKNRAVGEIFICQMEWSGGYAFEFDNQQYGPDSSTHRQNNALSLRVMMDSPQPIYVAAPGETFVSPKVDMGVLFGDLDDAVNAMNEHVRRSVLTRPADEDFDLVESGIGPEYDMSRESTLKAIDAAADIGSEVFFIDAGWYLPPDENRWWAFCGNWTYDPKRYPNGIDEIREYVHGRGMRFGMWMDAERICSESTVASEHPEWIAKTYDGKPNGSGNIDLTNPEAAAWMRAQIVHLIEDYKIDMFRLDWNVSTYNLQNYSVNGEYLENTFARHCKAVYGVFESIRRQYPHLILENCAGGGGRTDLGMVSNFNHTWVSDWQKAPRSFGTTNGMTLCLPPECVDRLIGGQGSFTAGDIRFQMHNLMFSHPTVGGVFPLDQVRHPGQFEYIRRSVGFYKNFVRPMIRDCRIYHHTPELEFPSPRGYGILEMASSDKSRGMLGVFRLSGPAEDEIVIRLRGVDISKKYRLTFVDSGESTETDGFALKNDGLRVRLGGALTSELAAYEEI